MKLLTLLLAFAGLVSAQISGFRVVGVTNTSALLAYRTSFLGDCTIEVSESGTYTPLSHDVNPSLYTLADSDSRFTALRDGEERFFVAGKRATEAALDGVKRSRALAAATGHYARGTCNGASATVQFTTKTVPFGLTFADLPPGDPNKKGTASYLWPTLNYHYQQSIIDPMTGVKHQIINYDSWAQGQTTPAGGRTFAEVTADAGWAPTSGTLTDAVGTASDGNVATSSTSDKLKLRLTTTGNALYTGTFSVAQLNYQNIETRYRCVGAGCAAATANLCVTYDFVNCENPTKSWTPATSFTDLVVCKDVPCSAAKAFGDWMTFDRPPMNGQYNAARRAQYNVYTTTGDNTTLKFLDAGDCNNLVSGETIWVNKSTEGSAGVDYALVLGTTSCGSSPPQISVTSSTPLPIPALDHNGTDGVPHQYKIGINSRRYGFLMWIEGASAALEVDSVKWVAASNPGLTLSTGSGGFGTRTTNVKDANGFYHSSCGAECMWAFKPEPDGTTTTRYMGWATITNGQLGSWADNTNGSFRSCAQSLGNFSSWDAEDANAFYCVMASSYPALGGLAARRQILVKLTYTGNDVAAPAPCAVEGAGVPLCSTYGNMQGQIIPVTAENLTPCLGACDDPDQDFTLTAQMKRVAGAEWDQAQYPSCGASYPQGKYISVGCSAGEQDSWSVGWQFDLGNGGIPGSTYVGSNGNTQQVVSFANFPKKKFSRFCGNHTYQGPIGKQDVAIRLTESDSGKCNLYTSISTNVAQCSPYLNNCQACPADIGTIDGVNYTGTNRCYLVTFNSAWNPAYGTQPSGFVAGDATSDGSCGAGLHWIDTWQVSDLVGRAGEYMKLLKKVSDGVWWVERAVGGMLDSAYDGKNHGSDATWATKCNAMELNTNLSKPEQLFGGWQWFFLDDPTATGFGDTYTYTRYVNHALHVSLRDGVGVRIAPKYRVDVLDFEDSAAMAQMENGIYLGASSTCASGKCASANGNEVEAHPSMSQVDATPRLQRSFLDVNPMNFVTPRVSDGGSQLNAVKVTGYLWKYGVPNSFSLKHNALAAFSGYQVMHHVSAPGVMLTGNLADHGKVCAVFVAGECYAGSVVGEVYFNMSNFDGQVNCRQSEFGGETGDKCIDDFPVHSTRMNEYLLPQYWRGYSNLNGARALTSIFLPYRSSVTGNVKASPDGTRVLFRDVNLIATIPPIPEMDSIDRAEFVPIIRKVSAPAGTDNVIVRFGYDPDTLRCNQNRLETCVANSAAIDRSNPYMFPAEGTGGVEAGLSGVACSSTCIISIPGMSHRVLYYQMVYRDGSNATIWQTPVIAVAVP